MKIKQTDKPFRRMKLLSSIIIQPCREFIKQIMVHETICVCIFEQQKIVNEDTHLKE